MSNLGKTDLIRLLIISGCILFAIEFFFIDTGLLFIIALTFIGIYFGRRSYHKSGGKAIFWGAVVCLFIVIINTIAVRFIFLVVIGYIVWKWYQSKPRKEIYIPKFSDDLAEDGTMYKSNWFGTFHKGKEPFAWQDLNLQSVISDVTIDLNNTVLPEEESVIVIRQLVGNIEIIVPYDVEVIVEHSVLYGEYMVMNDQEQHAFNRSIYRKTDGYDHAPQKVKIFTQVLVGKLEVKRG
ncbi:cell wall-active antibiotics response protein [Gracilibacillus oryzae]|uniref:Cell wall-active antibiotics response protein n=1 Tax=Gracilibacillus oryzae TaxID=1672701 RepID=A0A7C8GQ67_9BACI|nr:cell wall-active antibiotics response protein LiaF [Gracilibacillus oryzae]KAB8125790.1 cell wall-active antibiotics response protein [Gracilibacillus oryzae]